MQKKKENKKGKISKIKKSAEKIKSNNAA